MRCNQKSDRNEKYKQSDQSFIYGNTENMSFVVLAYSPQLSDLQVLGRESHILGESCQQECEEKLDDIEKSVRVPIKHSYIER